MNTAMHDQYLSWAYTPINTQNLYHQDFHNWVTRVFTELLEGSKYLKYPNIQKDPKGVISDEIPNPDLEIRESDENDLLVSRDGDIIYCNLSAIRNKDGYIPFISGGAIMVLFLNEIVKYYQENDPKIGKDIWIHLEILATSFNITPLMMIEAIPLMTGEESFREAALKILNKHLTKSNIPE